MMLFEHEELEPERGGEFSVGSAENTVSLMTEEDSAEVAALEMEPAEARALAALLVKHADRAEGKS